MKTVYTLLSLLSSVSAYSDLVVSSLTTHQPNGSPSGQVNYYSIAFTVNSANSNPSASGYCHASWGDNYCAFCNTGVAYSVNVPTGSYISCDSSRANLGDQTSEFGFQLYPYFSIGNFSVSVQQSFTDYASGSAQQVIASGMIHVTNTTAQYTCTINPQEITSATVHASGDCSIPPNQTPYQISLTTTTTACQPASTVQTSFPVTAPTTRGQSVHLTGNISELENWNPANAIPLDADQYTASQDLWNGTVSLPAGIAFEYKYLLRDADGGVRWECCENRRFVVSGFTCGMQTAGKGPDYFRD
ncbi:laccase, multicopper oxidase, benzenediol:oxygen oxidorectuctase [Elasticomyces elasticus]|nr:laccase, multicopper oxidase, benzenediol:oxygen oxidorectuctase [Elasticomyces elasticus]